MLGLDKVDSNAVMWTGGVSLTGGEAEEAIAHAHYMATTGKIRAFAESVQGSMDLVYMNYAEPGQDPLGSYGAEHVQFIRDVASKYDPVGAFQSRVRGGFKISRVS